MPNKLHQSTRQLREVDRVLAHMKTGITLQVTNTTAGPCWTLSDGRRVSAGVAELVVRSSSVAPVSGGLFEGAPAQVWAWWKDAS